MVVVLLRCEARECDRADVMKNGQYELAGCTALYFFSNQSNTIGDEGARALAETLKTNSALTKLSIPSNSIGDVGAKALAEALKSNSALTTLDLEGNLIGDEGAMALAEVLKSNGVLTALDLEGNLIGDEGAMALAAALKSNGVRSNGVAALDLEGNSYGHESARALDAARATAQSAAAVKRATSLGIYSTFQEYSISDDALIRAVQWCSDMGADTADDLAYLRPEEILELVANLGLPKLKQRRLADALSASLPRGKDEV